MQTWTIEENDAGRRLARFVQKKLPLMPVSLLNRMLRQNGFRLNGKREHKGDQILKAGDCLSIYLTDEQIASFSGKAEVSAPTETILKDLPPIAYEDDRIVAFDKPAGMLSQKAAKEDLSLAEIGAAYITGKNGGGSFVPGPVNRLDRNTSGLILMGKSLRAQQALSEMVRLRKIEKIYYAIVHGLCDWKEPRLLVHAFAKNEKTNSVRLSDPAGSETETMQSLAECVQTDPAHKLSLLRIHLITGRSHQIRAQLAREGFPLVGDPKYGKRSEEDRKLASRQLLCAKEIIITDPLSPLEDLKGLRIEGRYPEDMQAVLSMMKREVDHS